MTPEFLSDPHKKLWALVASQDLQWQDVTRPVSASLSSITLRTSISYPLKALAATRARAIVQAVTHFRDPKVLAEVSTDLGEAMVGLNVDKLSDKEKLAHRGW